MCTKKKINVFYLVVKSQREDILNFERNLWLHLERKMYGVRRPVSQ